ncbi:MAG: sugar phosphate isomerase/epimerase family protein [Pseudomonadota bacterium]
MAETLFLSLCNEMLADEGLTLSEQCSVAKALGYKGLELAPGSLGAQPHRLEETALCKMRDQVEAQGMRVTGLHWLLSPYPQASIVDPSRNNETRSILLALVDQCAILGGDVLVHGSPSSRFIPQRMDEGAAWQNAVRLFKDVAARAEERRITYCIEPLSRAETAFINTVEEAFALVEAVGSPAFQTMIDTSAAGQAETMPVADLIEHWVPKGCIAHIQVNDTNRAAPGAGEDPFHNIVSALHRVGWNKPVAVEPFKQVINATTTAAIGAATMNAHWRAAGANAKQRRGA